MRYINIFIMLLTLVVFASQSFGDNTSIGNNASSSGIDNNSYHRNGSSYGADTHGANRTNNSTDSRSGKQSGSSGYFPLGSDLRDKPVKHYGGQSLNNEAN
ncbi:MAG: hypothetical protein ACYCSS_13920 [Sulfuriferula sp.]